MVEKDVGVQNCKAGEEDLLKGNENGTLVL